MAANNVIKKVEIQSGNNLTISKLLGAEAQNIDVGFDANGDIIEDITITPPTSTEGLSTVLKETQGAVTWTEENVLGAKNFIPIGESVAAADGNGIAYNVADDGTITLTGTATAQSTYEIELPEALDGEYKFTIDCANLSTAGVGVTAVLRESDGSTNIVWFGPSGETDGSKEVAVPANSDVKFFAIVVSSAATVSGLAIKPMLRLASIKNRIYVPYAKTNRQLTTDIADLIDGGAGHNIVDPSGTTTTKRSNLQFVDSTITDDSANDTTKVEIVKQCLKADLASAEDGIYQVTDESDSGITALMVGYNNTSSGLAATSVQAAIDEVAAGASITNTFSILTTDWVANSDSDGTDFPYKAEITTSDYTSSFHPSEVLLLGATADDYPTSAETEELEKVDMYVKFTGTIIRLRATDEPLTAFTLVVKS